MNKIFISYSSDDRELREIFETRLRPYLQSTVNKFANVWTDKQIPLGGSWNAEIQEALAESNIGILLVSPMFLGSQYSMGDELQNMLKRREDGYLIVPVLLRECNFTNIPELRSIQFFKTYQSEYDITDLNRSNKLMAFEELAEVPNPSKRLLNRYFQKLANMLDDALIEQSKNRAKTSNTTDNQPPATKNNNLNLNNSQGGVFLQDVQGGSVNITVNSPSNPVANHRPTNTNKPHLPELHSRMLDTFDDDDFETFCTTWYPDFLKRKYPHNKGLEVKITKLIQYCSLKSGLPQLSQNVNNFGKNN